MPSRLAAPERSTSGRGNGRLASFASAWARIAIRRAVSTLLRDDGAVAGGAMARVGSIALLVAGTAMLAGMMSAIPPVSGAQAPPPPWPSSLVATAPDAATAAFDRFLAVYWSPQLGAFYAQSDHRARAGGSVLADFWWSAQLWQLVMDSYERSHRSSDRALIDRVYDGFVTRNKAFSSDFNDDRGWWALAATRAYQLTGERRFLVRAESLFDGVWRSWDTKYGGGIWWRKSTHDQKNMATNAPAVVTAIRLFRATGDARYRSRAIAIFRWLDGHLRTGTELDDHIEGAGNTVNWQFTYNYGAYLDAAAELSRLTHSATYLARATAAAERGIADLASDGVLRDEGTGDAGGFKGIFVRNLAAFARATGQTRFLDFLASNARVASENARYDSLWGPAWSHPPGSGPIESLTDHSAVALFLVAPSTQPATTAGADLSSPPAMTAGADPSVTAGRERGGVAASLGAQAADPDRVAAGPVNAQAAAGMQPVGQPPVSPQPVGQPPVSPQPVGQPPVSPQPVGQPPVSLQPAGGTGLVAAFGWMLAAAAVAAAATIGRPRGRRAIPWRAAARALTPAVPIDETPAHCGSPPKARPRSLR